MQAPAMLQCTCIMGTMSFPGHSCMENIESAKLIIVCSVSLQQEHGLLSVIGGSVALFIFCYNLGIFVVTVLMRLWNSLKIMVLLSSRWMKGHIV